MVRQAGLRGSSTDFRMAPKRKREPPRLTSLQVVVDVGASSGSSCVGSTRKYDIACSLVESLAFEEEAELELGLVFCGSDVTCNQLEGYDNTEIMFPLLPLHEAPAAIQAASRRGRAAAPKATCLAASLSPSTLWHKESTPFACCS